MVETIPKGDKKGRPKKERPKEAQPKKRERAISPTTPLMSPVGSICIEEGPVFCLGMGF
jgi:hypothetical protein